MFFISLLWRMEATQREAFNGFSAGPYTEKLRVATIEANPGLVPHLEIIIARFADPLAEAILFPTRQRIDGINGWRICFAQHACWLKLDQRRMTEPFRSLAVGATKELYMLNRDFRDGPEFRAMLSIASAR